MTVGRVKMAKISPETKNKLKEIAVSKRLTMTDLVKKELRELLQENGLPTI